MRIAAIQMCSGTELEANLKTASRLLQQAADQGAELAVLPEYFCIMGQHENDKLALKETLGRGLIQDWLAGQAHDLGLWLVGGSMPLRSEQADEVRSYNTCLVFSPTGQRIARYDKMHLFHFSTAERSFDEAATQLAGQHPATFELPSRDGHHWRIGLSICYDLRFAELYRHYAAEGVELMLAPSAFTYKTGQKHWELLLRTRAVENLAFLAAPAQGGQHENGRSTWGHSMIVDPWGFVLARRAEGEGVVMAELDIKELQKHRQYLPALQHRVL